MIKNALPISSLPLEQAPEGMDTCTIPRDKMGHVKLALGRGIELKAAKK